MWNPNTRRQYSRNQPRHETDLTDSEWEVLSPLFPPPARRGRKPVWPVREIVNAIFYVLRDGIPWRLIPKDLPPKKTVLGYFCLRSGDLDEIRLILIAALYSADGATLGCSRGSTVASSQWIASGSDGRPRRAPLFWTARASRPPRAVARAAMMQARRSRAANGRQWWTWMARALVLDPQPADIQDRDGAIPVLQVSRRSFPFVEKAFADMGYSGDRPQNATLVDVEIIRKPKDQVGFAVHPKRWVVERFFAWISRNRRLWKAPEATIKSAEAFLYPASIMTLTRRIARS